MQSVKKLALLFLFVLLSPLIAHAQWPYVPVVQSITNHASTGPTVTCVFNQNVTSGNLIVMGIVWNGTSATPSFSDTRSTSFTQNVADFNSPGGMDIYSGTLGSSGAETITVTLTSQNELGVSCVEFPPNWTLTVDASHVDHFTGTPASVTGTSITTTLNTDLLFTCFASLNGNGNANLDSASTGTFLQTGSQNGFFGSIYTAFGVAGTNGSYNVKWDNTGAAGTLETVAFQSKSLAITSAATAPDGALSNAYSYTLLAAGGKGAYTWSITGGSLQSGLSINSSTGAITGTPTSGPTNSITFQVADTNSHSATEAISLKVAIGINTPTFVQGKVTAGGATLAFTSGVGSGDLVVAFLSSGGGNANTGSAYCTDTLGTPFQKVGMMNLPLQTGGTPAAPQVILAGFAPSSGADTVACGSVAFLAGIAEISGVNYVGNDNVAYSTGSNATPATVTSSSLTTLVPTEIIVDVCGGYTGTWTTTSPFTSVGGSTNSFSNSGYDVVSSVTGYTAQCSYTSNTSGQWGFALLGIRPSGTTTAPAGGYRHQLITD